MTRVKLSLYFETGNRLQDCPSMTRASAVASWSFDDGMSDANRLEIAARALCSITLATRFCSADPSASRQSYHKLCSQQSRISEATTYGIE